jgi:hypothetical protein
MSHAGTKEVRRLKMVEKLWSSMEDEIDTACTTNGGEEEYI